jgi:urease accessory protein
MLRATSVVRKGQIGPRHIAGTITLDRQSRYRRRVVLKMDDGGELLLDLAEATYMADGDAVLLEGGSGVVLVKAAAEDLMEIRAADPLALARIAWHLGNRHTPAQIRPDAILIQPDHVLAEMVRGLGAEVRRVRCAFEPEGGAYGGHGALQHGQHHHHGHDHHSHDHQHGSAAHPRGSRGPERGA